AVGRADILGALRLRLAYGLDRSEPDPAGVHRILPGGDRDAPARAARRGGDRLRRDVPGAGRTIVVAPQVETAAGREYDLLEVDGLESDAARGPAIIERARGNEHAAEPSALDDVSPANVLRAERHACARARRDARTVRPGRRGDARGRMAHRGRAGPVARVGGKPGRGGRSRARRRAGGKAAEGRCKRK